MVAKNLRLPHEFHCFTDDEQDYPRGIIKRDLPHPGLRGWWNKIALFKPGVFSASDRVLYLDLDTLITGNIGEIAAYDGEHMRLAPFFSNVNQQYAGPQSGVMAWHGGYGEKIWQTFVTTQFPDLPGGDQKFLNMVAPDCDLLQDKYPGKVVSFRGCGGVVPAGTAIVCFHGIPSPHQIWPDGWADWAPEPAFKTIGGYLWPATDMQCWPATFGTVERDMEAIKPHLRERNVCIQAGGNVGVYANALSRMFHTVHSFEPDATLFRCLKQNIDPLKVIAHRAALVSPARHSQLVGFNPVAINVGQSHMGDGDSVFGQTIDSLGLDLDGCDLIYLDIEGYEKFALEGAEQTINAHRPVIVIEETKLSERYGVPAGSTPKWLMETHNYQIAAETGRDIILTPKT